LPSLARRPDASSLNQHCRRAGLPGGAARDGKLTAEQIERAREGLHKLGEVTTTSIVAELMQMLDRCPATWDGRIRDLPLDDEPETVPEDDPEERAAFQEEAS
jgi:hypothetical protein